MHLSKLGIISSYQILTFVYRCKYAKNGLAYDCNLTLAIICSKALI